MQTITSCRWNQMLLGCVVVFLACQCSACYGQQTIRKDPTWRPATIQEIRARFESWISESDIDSMKANRVREYLSQNAQGLSENPLDQIITAISLADEAFKRFNESLVKSSRPECIAWNQESWKLEFGHPFVRNHAMLVLARWLVRSKRYDESLSLSQQIDFSEILDTGSLLYHRGVTQHQLMQKAECIKTLRRLREQEEKIPRRHGILAKLMLADIEGMKADSLDEIARMMGEVQRRAGLNRSGQRVLDQEKAVIRKLDTLIEQLEKAQQQQASSAKPGSPSTPADRERRLGGQGSGNVKSKRQSDGGQWGNMDPEERDAALAEMAKDLPPHYRSVIEEYFRKLASQTEKRP